MAKAGSTNLPGNLLDNFISEVVTIYLSEGSTSVQTQDGDVAEIPLVVEGVLWDYDYDFLLVGDEQKVTFSLVNREFVIKVDLLDRKMEAMLDPSKPDTESMN